MPRWFFNVGAALLAIVTIVGGWMIINDPSGADHQCPDGKYTLAVWASPESAAQAKDLAKRYNKTHPVADERCINAQVEQKDDATVKDALAASVDDKNAATQLPGIWIPQDTPAALAAAEQYSIAIDSTEVPVHEGGHAILPISSTRSKDSAVRAAASSFSNFSMAELGADSLRRVSDLRDPRPSATGQSDGAQSDGAPGSAGNNGSPEGQATDGTQDSAAPLAGAQFTFLLDTSGSMGLVEGQSSRLDNVRAALKDKMLAVGREGAAVALWNYSSPLSRTAQVPYRANVELNAQDDGRAAGSALDQLSFGGATYTYESLLAAYGAAVAARDDQQVSRVVLVTDGPNDGGRASLEQAVAEIERLHRQSQVQLDVVTIGDNTDIAAMNQLASAGGGSVHTASDSTVVGDALAAATGITATDTPTEATRASQ